MSKIKLFTAAALAVLLFSTNLSYAQEQRKIHLGIRGGLNYTNLYSEDNQNTDYLYGYTAGVFAKIQLVGFVSLQPELNYTTKGADVNYNIAIANGTARFKFNYLEVPLLVVLDITPFLSIHAGPYIAYLLDGSVRNQSNVTLLNFEETLVSDDYNKTDAGFAFGTTVNLGSLSVGARFNLGLTTVGKERTFIGTPYTFPNAKNHVFSLYISALLF